MLGFVTPRLFWDVEGTPQEEVYLEMQSCELGVCVGGRPLCPVEGSLYPDEAQDE